MPRLDAERRQLAEDVRRELAIEAALLPPQARLFVRCLQIGWNVREIQWTPEQSQHQLQDARRLVHAASVFTELDGPHSVGAIDCYRRAGELFEWLARAKDDTRLIAPLALLAGGCFQLGGLPAMATSLLNQDDIVAQGTNAIYAQFFRADFDAVIQTCSAFWQENENLTGRRGSAVIFEAEPNDEFDMVAWHTSVELVRCLGLIADSLRRGDGVRLAAARNKLTALQRFALHSTSDDAWLIVSLLAATAERYASTNVYPNVLPLGGESEELTGRLRKFAREQFARGRGILWSSQIAGLEMLMREPSFALCTPTGSGKTLVANLALLRDLLVPVADGRPAPLALYLVPSRALAGEVEAKLTSELGRSGDFTITGLYGGADWGITDYWLTGARATVLIATVEKADALMRYLGPMLLTRLKLLILDEAHQVVNYDERSTKVFADHASRPLRLESFVSRVLTLKPTISRIALTAVAGGAAAPVSRWVVGVEDAEPIGIRYRSTRQLVGALEVTYRAASKITLDLMNGARLRLLERGNAPVYLPLQIPEMPNPPAKVRNSLNHYNQISVLWTALHLKEAGRKRILVSVMQSPEDTMRWFSEALASPGWDAAAAFVPPVEQPLRMVWAQAMAACIDYCGTQSYEFRLLTHGIATNHGQMPQRLRRLMTDLIERRICPITVATATLTEGVNLPFDFIFLTSLCRTAFDSVTQAQGIKPITTSEFRNLAGRAGRPGSADGIEGMTLVSIPQRPSSTANSQIPTQRRQLLAMKERYEDLLRRLDEEGDANVQIDSPLAALIEVIRERARTLLGVGDDRFDQWLEVTAPRIVSANVGQGSDAEDARLADSMDELDGILLAAIEELHKSALAAGPAWQLEATLGDLWRRTFSHVASVHTARLEQAFIRRGFGIVNHIYPDPALRARLYQYGFSPCIGERFEDAASDVLELLAAGTQYGTADTAGRFDFFEQLAELVSDDPGYGFRYRETAADQAIKANWSGVFSWWMQAPGAAEPPSDELRNWQRFVSDNLEFRFGVALGAVVAQAWAVGSNGIPTVPTLATWRQVTGLPWIGFWARELLRWGTLDPFVAFCLSQSRAFSRADAAALRPIFDQWLGEVAPGPGPEDFIDPQRFLEWMNSIEWQVDRAPQATVVQVNQLGAAYVGRRYSVAAMEAHGQVTWFDPAGFALARSAVAQEVLTSRPSRCDFVLVVGEDQSSVERIYAP